MTTIRPLEIQNRDSTEMVELTKFSCAFYVRPTAEHPWMPVVLDASTQKRALRVIKDASKGSIKAKLRVRESAIENLIAMTFPDEDWVARLKIKQAVMA
jgi:hypothetical protein